LTGRTTDATLTLDRYGVAVLATPRAERPPFLTLASDTGRFPTA